MSTYLSGIHTEKKLRKLQVVEVTRLEGIEEKNKKGIPPMEFCQANPTLESDSKLKDYSYKMAFTMTM